MTIAKSLHKDVNIIQIKMDQIISYTNRIKSFVAESKLQIEFSAPGILRNISGTSGCMRRDSSATRGASCRSIHTNQLQ